MSARASRSRAGSATSIRRFPDFDVTSRTSQARASATRFRSAVTTCRREWPRHWMSTATARRCCAARTGCSSARSSRRSTARPTCSAGTTGRGCSSIHFRSASPGGRCQDIACRKARCRCRRVTITVGPEAQTPRVHQVSGGLTRLLGAATAVSVDVVYARGLNQLGSPRIQPDCAGTGSWPPAQRHRHDGGHVHQRLAVHRLRRDVVSRPAGVGHATVWNAWRRRACPTRGRPPRTTSRDTQARSKTTASGRNPADPNGPPLGFDASRERGPADTDQPHRVVVSGTWSAPWRLEVSGILTAASGVPFTPLAGADLNGDGVPTADRARVVPADASSSVGRNSERLPAQATADLRVARPIRLSARVTLTPMVEVFNLFNRTNFSEVNNIFGTGAFPTDPLRDANGRTTYGAVPESPASPPGAAGRARRVLDSRA